MRINKKLLAGIISALMLVGAPSAMAASAAQSGYSKPGAIVESTIQNNGGNEPGAVTETSAPGGVTETHSAASGSLPFTGLDVVLVVAAGGVLLALGLGMRRLTRTSEVA